MNFQNIGIALYDKIITQPYVIEHARKTH